MWFQTSRCKTIVPACALVLLFDGLCSAQTSNAADQHSETTAVRDNGTQRIADTLETEHKTTSEGEVEVQRFRSPSYAGDQAVIWEREVRTKKLPDGTIEKEYVVKNPDGGNHLTPVQVIREKMTPGANSSTVQREMLQPDFEGHWQPVQKEVITEQSSAGTKQTRTEIQQPDATGSWQVVDRRVTSSRPSASGEISDSVRQVPDAQGRLSDYERRQERVTQRGDTATHELTLQRRDFSDSEARQFYLVEHTTDATNTKEGMTNRHVVTQSDMLPNSPARNYDMIGSPQVIRDQVEQTRKLPGGASETVSNVSERTAGDPTSVRPTYQVIQQKDENGYVRKIYIPAQ